MYTVMVGDDGMFSAEYVVPPALSIPLGTSGSAVDVVRNEDGTFSADGEVITAETRVTAANGNVYAAVLSPEGVPVSAMHVAAMQDVMLGELGGTVKLTQAEDMSWWLGETAVADGSVHTHENGNMYTLMMDAEGMWSAMYKKVEVIVQLGTQHPITLERDEDMSWRLGSEAVDVASEVMSDNGNTYTLWYTDGVWSARFEPESMMIEGTGLVAMTREDSMGYDVEDAMLPSSGGDIETSMGTYRVSMTDGMLMGTRLDAVTIDGNTDFGTLGLSGVTMAANNYYENPSVSIRADEDDTEDVNEAATTLVVVGEEHPFSALLGSGMSEKQGANFVADARKELMEIRAKLEAVLDVFETDGERDQQVQLLWGTTADGETPRGTNVVETLEKVFGEISGFRTADGFNTDADPDDNDAISEIDDLIMALSSVDSLAAALEDDGVLDKLGVDDNDKTATQIFDATNSESSVSYGMTGMTRYGAVSKKVRDYAVSDASYMHDTDDDQDGLQDGDGELGAFAFGVTSETARAHHVATAGNAYYEGGTLAVDQAGTHYSGDISLRVRFATNRVDGLITNLVSEDGNPWVYLFDNVSSINLPMATLAPAGYFGSTDADGEAEISYAFRAGSSRATPLPSKWRGRLLGTGSNAGYQAVGSWSVGENHATTNYLAGGFGAERTSDEPDQRPALDDGTNVETKLLGPGDDTVGDTTGEGGLGMTALADGTLTITVGKFGYTRNGASPDDPGSPTADHTWMRLDDGADETTVDTTDAMAKYDIDLANLMADPDEFNHNGDIHRAVARTMIEAEREKLAVLIETDQLGPQQIMIWQNVQEILMTRIFDGAVDPDTDATAPFSGRLPDKVAGVYNKDTALETIDQIIWALSSDSNLESALDKDESALFVQDDGETPFASIAPADIFVEKELQVKAWSGMTDFTRFGVWRVRRSRNALRSGNWARPGESDSFAYSPLTAAKITSPTAPNYPTGAVATYTGSTVAFVFAANGSGTGYTGDVSVRVEWNQSSNATIGATVQTVISNLQNINGDLFAIGGNAVRELVFDDVEMTVASGTDGDNLVDFAETSGNVDAYFVDRSVDVDTTTLGIQTHAGQFVGSSSDGPLGVIGRYQAGGDNSAAGSLKGAYGADLP